MTLSRFFQAATNAGIAAVAAVTAVAGLGLALFDTEVRLLRADAAVPPPAERTQWVEADGAKPDTAEALAGWRTTPGVGGAARVLIAARPDASLPQRLLDIGQALSVTPTDGALWLAYADTTLRLGYGVEPALRAYDMATLTARREGDQMLARALLVLRAWEEMPDDRREAAMGGLGDVGRRLKKSDREEVAAAVKAKTPEARGEIAAALAVRLGGDKKLSKAFGL